MYRSMDELMNDPAIQQQLLNVLLATPALQGCRRILNDARRLSRPRKERRCSGIHTFTQLQVAKAAGVRVSLIKKYVCEGVRGTGRLVADEKGKVGVYALERFASRHTGHARDVALKALGRLGEEPAQKPSMPSAALHTQKTVSSVA